MALLGYETTFFINLQVSVKPMLASSSVPITALNDLWAPEHTIAGQMGLLHIHMDLRSKRSNLKSLGALLKTCHQSSADI